MLITDKLFAAFLNCQTKAYLKSSAIAEPQTKLIIWRNRFENQLRKQGVAFLQKQNGCNLMENPTVADFSAKGSALYVNCSVGAGELTSLIDAIEKIELRGRNTQWLPCRCRLDKRAEKHEKLQLAYDALCLQTLIGVPIRVGKLVDGVSKRVQKVQLKILLKAVQDHIRRLTELLSQEKEPPLILNKHCGECEFQARCRAKAVEIDDLSLLAKMSLMERQKLKNKGIFTVTQLSYTFRPRRRRKSLRSNSVVPSYPLRALAIRENKIHVAGSPTFTIQENDCFLDVEGIPNDKFYYLVGVQFPINGRTIQHSFWARDHSEEETMWNDLVAVLGAHEYGRIIHYGNFEKEFLTIMNKRYSKSKEQLEYGDRLIHQSVNLLTVIYGQIYFPTYSNSLKDIARYLGHRWPDKIGNGYEALLARHYWEVSEDQGTKEALVNYNASDCESLKLVAHRVSEICGQLSIVPNADLNFVDANKIRGVEWLKFGQLYSAVPDFEYINRASYWDYQRERIFIRSKRLSKRLSQSSSLRRRKYGINKVIKCRRMVACPACKSRTIYKYGLMSRNIYDLKFSPHGVKRWSIKYRYDRHICWTCKKTFMPRSMPPTKSKFGNGLACFLVFLTIDLQISQSAATRFINQFFGLDLSRESAGRFKKSLAEFYAVSYKKILRALVRSSLVHVDETKVSLNGQSAYVWVLANQEHVAYFVSENREGAKIQDTLKSFKGVLVSDFYSVYHCCPN